MDTTFGTDQTKRVPLDVNQVISPTLAIRAGGLFQDANVAGREYVTDDRDGGFVAATWKPLDAVKITGNYIHTELNGIPDFGVPYYRPSTASTAGGPFPDFGVNRNNFYGFVNRDFFRTGTGYRHDQRRGSDHARPDAEQQDQGIALDAELYRHASGIAGDHQPAVRLDAHRQSAEPLSDHRRIREPDRGDLQVRRWFGLQAHGAGRRRISPRNLVRSTVIPGLRSE